MVHIIDIVNKMNNYYEEIKTPAPKKTGFARKVCTFILCGLLFGASGAAAFTGVDALLDSNTASAESTVTNAKSSSASEQKTSLGLSTVSYSEGNTVLSQTLDVSDIAEGMMPSMVSLTNISVQEVESYFGMFGRGKRSFRGDTHNYQKDHLDTDRLRK